MNGSATRILPADRLGDLVAALVEAGYEVWGPTERDGAIVLRTMDGVETLPRGRRTRQEGGSYRMEPSGDGRWFAATHGPHSGKTLFYPSDVRMWRGTRTPDGVSVEAEAHELSKPIAYFGARACDVAAILIQDRVLLEGAVADPVYAARRKDAFIVTVHCAEPAAVCFCASMDAGPRARRGFDLALGEIDDGYGHRFAVEIGSARGAELIAALCLAPASSADEAAIDAQEAEARDRMGRQLDRAAARRALAAVQDIAAWDDVADRCLRCSACVMSCPTCFCTTATDVADVSGTTLERRRQWDGCFSIDFTHMQHGPSRPSPGSRYRHWITHKLSAWEDQFDTPGCVGCGRCIAWCPVGIDIVQEAERAIEIASGARGS